MVVRSVLLWVVVMALLMFAAGASAQVVLPNTARLTWDGVAVIESNPQSNVGYRVYQQQLPCVDAVNGQWQNVSGDIPAGTLTWTATGLQDNRTYCWYVTAFTPLAESPPSSTGEKYIPFPGATPAPGNFLAQ